MVHIMCFEELQGHDDLLFQQYKNVLTDRLLQRLSGYRFKEDRERSLIGMILLLKGLKVLNVSDLGLHDIKYTRHNKPYFTNKLSFNISHSKSLVVCAISKDYEVGVDIEYHNKLTELPMKYCFSDREIEHIEASADPQREFYRLWTRKESVVKAAGSGLSTDLKLFNVLGSRTIIGGKQWNMVDLYLKDNYSSCLSAENNPTKIKIYQANFCATDNEISINPNPTLNQV